MLTKGWKAKANQDLVQKVKTALEGRRPKPKLHYVPGHSGVALNEIADALARTAVETRGSRRAKLDTFNRLAWSAKYNSTVSSSAGRNGRATETHQAQKCRQSLS